MDVTLRTAAGLGLMAILGGCTSDEWPPAATDDDGESASGTATDEGGDGYEFAQLEVLEPSSASVFPIGSAIHLLAEVRDPSGSVLPVDDVAWVADDSDVELLAALEGDVELPPGVYDLSAIARLPNGDRLQHTVGGIRVQAPWTGEYEGDVLMTIAVEFQGIPLAPRCDGPLSIRVGLDGQDFEAEPGGCTLDVAITTLEATYVITGSIDDAGIVTGSIDFSFQAPTGPFEIPVEWTGAFADGAFGAGLSDTVSIPLLGNAEISGSLRADLINANIDPDQ
ncbi:MAG: hypothetical protein K0V04_08480 [Deltaproteobacteria bacterium]|nr:hypothetical protein [Deltaproteobacteria bacterium]